MSGKQIIGFGITAGIIAILVYALATSIIDYGQDDIEKLPTRNLTIQNSENEDIIILAEIADENAERMKGLMYRKKLGENEGMLFIFPQEQPLAFWMKNTLIPLDMMFIDSEGIIVDIKEDVQPCKIEMCPSYPSKENGQYVVEVNAGFTEKKNINIGDKILIE